MRRKFLNKGRKRKYDEVILDHALEDYFDEGGDEDFGPKNFLSQHRNYQIPLRSFQRAVQRYRNKEKVWREPGCPLALPPVLEHQIEEEVLLYLEYLGRVSDDLISRVAVGVAAQRLPGEMDNSGALNRVLRCGGREWVQYFKFRKGFHTLQGKKSLDIERVIKTQPEITANHFRRLTQILAMIQIHRKIARGMRVEDWDIKENVATYTGRLDQIGDSLVVVRGGKLWVSVLDEPLEPIKPNLRFNIDEKPILPDSPILKVVSLKDIDEIAGGSRGSAWTVVLVIRANGQVDITPAIILRGSSIAGNIFEQTKVTTINGEEYVAAVTATPKGIQTEETFHEYIQIFGPETGATREEPGLIDFDGHGSHLSRRVEAALASHWLYCLAEPSQTSTLHQALDNGGNAELQAEYNQRYTCGLSAVHGNGGVVSLECKVRTLILALHEFKKKPHPQGWKRIGQPNGELKPGLLKVKRYLIGEQYRDSELPKVTQSLLRNLFSLKNLAKLPGSEFTYDPKEVEVKEAVEELEGKYALKRVPVQEGEIRRCMFTRLTTLTVEQRVRILQKEIPHEPTQSEYDAIQKGGTSRLDTYGGRILFGPRVSAEFEVMEEDKQKKQEEKQQRSDFLSQKITSESPISGVLEKFGYLPPLKNIATKENLLLFAKQNQVPLRRSGKRDEIFHSLAQWIHDKQKAGQINFIQCPVEEEK